jgi:signal transduction histidine kinase
MTNLHQELQKRIAKANGIGAMVITLLVMASAWGDWAMMATIGVINALVIAANMFVTFVLLSRLSHRNAEITRAVINLSTGVLIAHITHWPLACFLFMPYTALVFDPVARKTTLYTVLAVCVVYSLGSYLDGVPLMTPFVFTVLTLFCYETSSSRHAVIRVMLAEAESGRDALNRAYHSLQTETAARERAELELAQHHKLEAVGRLAAGIAHEINTPVQFVADSVSFIDDGNRRLLALVDRQSRIVAEATSALDDDERTRGRATSLRVMLDEARATADLDYLRDELPLASERVHEGVERVTHIMHSVRQFAHPDKKESAPVDLNESVRTALTIAAAEYRLVADVETELAELPAVLCHAGEVNQVLLNLVVNAAHAIEEKQKQTGKRGTIRVRTRVGSDHVAIEVHDTGVGIPEHLQGRIFEAFFTTKPVGQGTGQSLAVSRAVIEKHDGRLTFESKVGEGTTFVIRLPLRRAAA